MRIMYVFDPREAEGYWFKAPEFVARMFCKLYKTRRQSDRRRVAVFDYAETPEGY